MLAIGMRVRTIAQWKTRIRADVLGVDDGGDGEDDDGGEDGLGGAREHLGHGHEPDRAGRLHAVLDLAGVAELLGKLQGDGLDALEHDADGDDAGHEDGGERRLARLGGHGGAGSRHHM